MKISDDYRAKIRLWAAAQRVVPLPAGPPLPRFTARRFSTHEEMNTWKLELLRQVARSVAHAPQEAVVEFLTAMKQQGWT